MVAPQGGSSTIAAWMPPKLIGPYRVLATLGSGGTGTVYRAIDRRTNEELALKLLSTGPALDPKAALRLAREFETLRDLSHPNVVRVFDTGVFQGYPYLAMELVEGLTLRHYLTLTGEDLYTYASTGSASDVAIPATEESASMSVSRTGIKPFTLSAFHEEPMSEEELSYGQGPDRLRELAEEISEPDTVSLDEESHPGHGPPPVVLTKERQKTLEALDSLNRPERMGRLKDAMLQLCEALAYVHGHGLVHRDLKPSNIMVDEDRLVRLMDFGLAKYLAEDSGVTAHGRLVGTFRYMSPEQILGEPLDARSDLYALGVMLYELLAGRAPFDAQNPQELWQKVLETEPPGILTLNPKTDTQLARVAHKLIRKEPDQRYQTAEEVYEALAE